MGGGTLRNDTDSHGNLRPTVETEINGTCYINTESTYDDVRTTVRRIGAETVDMHRIAVQSLRDLSTCNEDRRCHTDWVCDGCTAEIGRIQRSIASQNSVLGRFLNDVLIGGLRDAHLTRSMCFLVAAMVERRVENSKYT